MEGLPSFLSRSSPEGCPGKSDDGRMEEWSRKDTVLQEKKRDKRKKKELVSSLAVWEDMKRKNT